MKGTKKNIIIIPYLALAPLAEPRRCEAGATTAHDERVVAASEGENMVWWS